jgi:hypothetical protein
VVEARKNLKLTAKTVNGFKGQQLRQHSIQKRIRREAIRKSAVPDVRSVISNCSATRKTQNYSEGAHDETTKRQIAP